MDCPICFESLTQATTGRTACGHAFCKDCLFKIRTSATSAQTCPLCRAPLSATSQPTASQPTTHHSHTVHRSPAPRATQARPPFADWVGTVRLSHIPAGGVISLSELYKNTQSAR